MAVGGRWPETLGGALSNPNAFALNNGYIVQDLLSGPKTMEVDYVRVYQKVPRYLNFELGITSYIADKPLVVSGRRLSIF